MSAPLVSIFMFCKNRSGSIARAIDSVLAQTWPHVEIVVQDAASTDGTVEILRGYGDAIKLVSAPDSGAAEGFLRALQRCRGEFIGSCLSDEELLPDAVARAVDYFHAHPQVAAITGDADIIDAEGRKIGEHVGSEFVLAAYLTGDYCPYFVSSFFRRSALERLGLMDPSWVPTSIEFEMWCELGSHFPIDYVPGKFGRYGIHPGQLSNLPSDIQLHMDGRLATFKKLFSPGGSLASEAAVTPLLMRRLMAGQCVMQFNHLSAYRQTEAARRYLDLYLLHARHYVHALATRRGWGYDDEAVTALLAQTPESVFTPGGEAVLSEILVDARTAPPPTPRPFPGSPARIILPPLGDEMFQSLADTLDRLGLPDQAGHCRRLARRA